MPPTFRNKMALTIVCDVCEENLATPMKTEGDAITFGRSKGWYCGYLFDACPNCRDKAVVFRKRDDEQTVD